MSAFLPVPEKTLDQGENPVAATGDLTVEQAILRTADALEKVFSVPGLTEAKRLYFAKDLNANLCKIELQAGKSRLKSWPSMIELPVAGKCNLRCTMCGLSHGNPQYPNWTLQEVARFREYLKFARLANPTGAGEPLTNKDFFKILELFAGFGVQVGFYTNATLLTADHCEKLIDLEVDQVNVSIDGATPGTYERVRRHAKFETVVGNVRRLVQRRRERGAQFPKLQIAMVLMRDTMHELPDLVRLAAEIGANSVYTMFEGGLLPEQRPQLEPARTNSYLQEARRVAAELGLVMVAPDDLPENPADGFAGPVASAVPRGVRPICVHPWRQLVISNTGGAGPCCRIAGNFDGVETGNIHDMPPEALWNNAGMVHLRERLVSGNPPKVCVECPLRTLHV